MLRAELRVPDVGEKGTWRVRLDTECTIPKENGSSTNTYTKEYDVQFAGTDHGARLSPLYKFSSPEKQGAKTCTWKITALHPDQPTEWTGSWSVPKG
jgi:hypothetical protein